MAVTKIIAVRHHLPRVVSYAANQEKTGLECTIDYAANPGKTEQRFFESVLNCESASTAFQEMQATKQKWRKTGGVLAYHFIQSFVPGEATPEQAHAIGVEFAKRCFGERFEVVIGTHLDRAHLHNHVVVNAVSFVDGKKYHSSPASYYDRIRATSDALCRENDLSVIDAPRGRGRGYSEWSAAQKGKPTIRQMVRDDVDEILSQAFTFQSFLTLLQKKGYRVRAGNRKHIAVIPPFSTRPIRLDSLGGGYTQEAIQERLQRQQMDGGFPAPRCPEKRVRRFRYRGKLRKIKKLHGFRALYFRYLYLLDKVRKRRYPRKPSRYLMDDVIRFEQLTKQQRFLNAHRMDTMEQLTAHAETLRQEIGRLTEARKPLYRARKREPDNDDLSEQIAAHTARLRQLRRDARLCDQIAKSACDLKSRFGAVQQMMQQREVKQHEPRKRSRRPAYAARFESE